MIAGNSIQTLTKSSDASSRNTLILVLDWGEKSSLLFKNAIEARKKLLLDYLYDIDIIHIEKWDENLEFSVEILPQIYYNGKLVAIGEALSTHEIVNVVLESENDEKKFFPIDTSCYTKKKPVFGAVAMQ